ncbi:MAG: hypothetical protein P1P64_07700 [Treponemataceae bacterium]
MDEYIYDKKGKPVGIVRNGKIYDMKGRGRGQIRGTHVYNDLGRYIGEFDDGRVLDKHQVHSPISHWVGISSPSIAPPCIKPPSCFNNLADDLFGD